IAPQSVYNFVYLARQGKYDGTIIHRIVPGFVIQGGDFENRNGTGGPGYSIKGEFAENGFENNLQHTRGVLSMARANDPNSGGSQFFICLDDVRGSLDNKYAAFGKVTSGMDVVAEIAKARLRVGTETPIKDVVIKTVTVSGPELPQPDKLPG
ncbi:MAG: peptidylprolyl isomerase, partial [Clostridia bacterium]|nr:peptidylprolyl isomerase [Clostridia bacterium]